MHYLYYVAVKKLDRTPEEAESLAQERLELENFASDNGGFWNNSKADWFVMGGRWSGHLQAIQMDDLESKSEEIIHANKHDKDCEFITDGDIKQNKEALQKLWESLGGKGKHKWCRNSYHNDEAEDDSMLLDEKLFNALKERSDNRDKESDYETEVAIIGGEEYIEDEINLSDFLAKKDIIGNYYMVVVDYHN